MLRVGHIQLKIFIDLEWRCSVSDWRRLPEAVLGRDEVSRGWEW